MLRTILLLAATANVLAFVVYGLDKWKAVRGWRRVPEVWLLGLALPGAAPGAWLGVKVFRHKSSKPSFLVRLFAVTLLNGALVYLVWRWIDGPQGPRPNG